LRLVELTSTYESAVSAVMLDVELDVDELDVLLELVDPELVVSSAFTAATSRMMSTMLNITR
jgi:hypothetical protein